MKERKMRRYQNLLTVSGLGVIIFGLWSVLKTILLLFMKEGILSEIPDDTFVRVMFFLILGGILLVDVLIRLYVGCPPAPRASERRRAMGMSSLPY